MTQIEQWIREEGRQEGRIEGELKGRQEGRREGGKEQQIKTARNMLKLGMAPELIANVTELPLDEILKMEKETQNTN